MDLGGGEIKIELFDQRAFEVRRQPAVGSLLMLTRFEMDPARIDENLEWFRREIAPQIMGGSGFQALRLLINPDSGEGLSGTVWEDRAALEKSAEAGAARREAGSARGITFGEIGFRHITSSERAIRTPADMKGLKNRTTEDSVHLAALRQPDAVVEAIWNACRSPAPHPNPSPGGRGA